jgi:hypothetical protein
VAQTKVIRIARPFTKGWITDRPRWSLDEQEMADGQDVIWPRGVAVKRRGWNYIQAENPIGTSTPLGGVMAVQLDPLATTVTYVVSDSTGKVGIANTGSSATAFTGTADVLYLPRTVWNGEVLLCPQDGVSPIRRWSGLVAAPEASAGTLTITKDRTSVTGAGSTFTSQAPQNSYIKLTRKGSFGYAYRVTDVESNTSLAVGTGPYAEAWEDRLTARPSVASVAWEARNSGEIGLKALVTNLATATVSGTSVTGTATVWSSGAPGHGAVIAGDIVARARDVDADAASASINNKALTSNVATLTTSAAHSFITGQTVTVTGVDATFNGTYVITGTPTSTTFTYARTSANVTSAAVSPVGTARSIWASTPDAGVVSSVSSDTAITLAYAPTDFKDSPYVILRPMPGREACAHQGRLWFTGIKWDPNRIYVSPSPDRWPDIGGQSNGEDSFDLDFASATQAKFVDIPDRFAPGEIVALLSARNVLLVLRDNALYGVFGSWPGIQVEMIADGAGCVDIRSTSSSEEGQFWCGPEGIYHYEAGRGLRDLTLGKNNRLWRSLMATRTSSAVVAAGVINSHLLVSFVDGENSQAWLYDLASEAWCGRVSGMNPVAMHNARLRSFPDDLYMVHGAKRQIAAIGSAFVDEDPVPEEMVLGVGVIGTGALASSYSENRGTFFAETGSVLSGNATSSFRTTQMRVGYECVEGSGLVVQTGDAETQAWNPHETETTLPATGYSIKTEKVRAKTSLSSGSTIGQADRQFSVRMAEDDDTEPSRLAVHEIQVVVREYDSRD